MKILIACEMPDFALEDVRALGLDVAYRPGMKAAELPAALDDVTVLVVSRLRVSAEAVHAGRSLQMIVCWDSDTSNIAIDTASQEGVIVSHCVETNAIAVAELAIGMLIALDRGLVRHADDLRQGRHDHERPVSAIGLAGHTIGLFNLSEVERSIARRARAFGAKVLAWTPGVTPEEARTFGVQPCEWIPDLTRDSDALVIYMPTMRHDELRVDANLLESIRDNSLLVYVGHPSGFDEAALLDAVDHRGLRLALDVLLPAQDPARVRFKTDLFKRHGVIGTYHLANRTVQAWHAAARQVVHIVRSFLVSGELIGCVNMLERSPATWLLVLRLRDAVGVLASIMDAIRADGINAEEVTSRVFLGARAAWCTIALDERPATDTLDTIRATDGVLHLELRAVV